MRKKIGIISLLMLISLIVIIPSSYGALSSKPTTKTDGSNVLVNKSVSDSYALCQQMISNGESLYGATVKPHLATNKDWGAVSYLSNSIYGTNTEGKNTGTQITINGVKYYSTTGNASGVMNWGSNPYKSASSFYTQTSAIVKAYMNLTNKTNANVQELVMAADNNLKYVEVIDTKSEGGFNDETLGMALSETMKYSFGQYKFAYQKVPGYPISARQGLFGFNVGNDNTGSWTYACNGAGNTGATFRPVVWN